MRIVRRYNGSEPFNFDVSLTGEGVMPGYVVSKAEFARQLHVSRARISQLSERGMPVRADGRIDCDAALTWIQTNVASHAGGWHMRRTGLDLASRASWLVASRDGKLAAQCELYEYLRSRLSEVPAILLKLGMPVPEAAAACEGLDILIGRWVLDFNPDLVSDQQAPSPEPNYVNLARRSGKRIQARRWEQRKEEVLDCLAEVLGV